jgi:endonuclease/exonuclease/phosphatase family metal-dependent hydrolase
MTLSMNNEQFPSFICISNCIKHGVMILVKKHITLLEHIHFKEYNVEVMLANIIVHGLQIAILNIYVGPHATLTDIISIITKALCTLHPSKVIIILGDFNIDMLQSNEKTKKLERYMARYNLHFLLDKKKHLQKPFIDHIWSSIANL